MSNTRLAIALALLCFVLAFIVAFNVRCAAMKKLDAEIWTPPPAVPGQETPATPPPLLETLAAILAATGFGGMSLWIRNNKKALAASVKENGDSVKLDIAALRERLARLEGNASPPGS